MHVSSRIGIRMRSIEWWHCRWPWVTPNPSNHPKFLQFCVVFRIFVVDEHSDFKFRVKVELVDHSKSQPTDDNLPLKGAWSCHTTNLKILVLVKYLGNGWC